MRRLLCLFSLFSLFWLFAADDEEEEKKGVRFRFNFPYQQQVVVGEPPAKDAGDHGHHSLSEAEMERLQTAVTEFVNKKRSQGGDFTMRDMVELYHTAQDFKVVHALLGDLITPRESWEIGTLRQKMHEEVLRNLANSGEFGHRMGVNDFGSGADPNKVDAKTDIDFTGYGADQGLAGKEIVARYEAEFRKVAAKYYRAVNPGQMDIVAHAYEATIPDWRQNSTVSSYELKMRTGLGLLAKNPEAYFLEGAYLQQVMRRSADPAAKTFAWYEKNEKGELVKRLVNATEVPQFFYQPDIAPRYAWGAAVGNWHFFHAHSDDLIAQAKYILRSMDDGAGLLMGKSKKGEYEKLSASDRDTVIRKLIRPFFGARDVAEIRAMMDTAAHMRALKSAKALKLGSTEGKVEAYRPLIEYERAQAGGLPMSDAELLRLAEATFQKAGQKLLLHNNVITSRERIKDWLMPPLRPGERLDYIDEHGRRRIFNVDADMIKRLQYSSFFELKAGLALMTPEQRAKIKRANPKFANDITILERVIDKQKQLYNGPEHLKPHEVLDFKERLLLDIRADWWNVRSKIKAKGVRSGVWAAGKALMARGDQIESWTYTRLFDGAANLAGGEKYLGYMKKLQAEVAAKQQQGLGTKWTMRLDRATSLIEIAKTYQREGAWNENVWKTVFYEGMSYLPGMGTVYGISGGISGVTTMTLVRLIPGYGQIVVAGQFVKSGVELVGLTIFEPLRHDRILLAYQGYLEPQEGGIFSTGQTERVESPRPSLFQPVDPGNALPLDERREKLYHYLHSKIVTKMLDDPRVWFTEDEFPEDWQKIEFEYVGKVVPEYINHWWTATGPFADFDELLGQRGPDIREPLTARIQKDYLVGKQRAIERQIQEREKQMGKIQELIEQVASEDIALAEELKKVKGELSLAGMLTYAAMLKMMPKVEPSMEIIAAPRTTDDGVISMQFRAKVHASMEDYPAPWKITWSVDDKDFELGDKERWENEGRSIKVKAKAFDAEGKLIIEKQIDLQSEKLGKEKDDEDEDEDEDEDQDEDAEEDGGIPSIVGQTSSDVLTAEAQCQQGRQALETANQATEQLREVGNMARERAEIFGALADTILTDGRQVRGWVSKANQIGEEIANARDEGGESALKACEALELIGKTREQDEKQALARKSEELAVKTEETFERIRPSYQELREILQKMRSLREASIDVRTRHGEFHGAFGQLTPVMSRAEEAIAQASAADAELGVLTDKLQDYQTRARAAAAEQEGEQVQQDAATVTALVQSVGDCPEELTTGVDEAQNAFADAAENLTEMEEGVEDLWARLEDSGLLAEIEEASQEIETLFSVVEMFFKSLRSYAKDARRCADLAHSEASKKEKVEVPNLFQKSLKVAEKLLFDAQLVPRRSAGSPAPSGDLEFHVESQDPPAGAEAEAGDRVTMKLYGKSAELVTVPNVQGMSISEAEGVLRGVGLVMGKSGGSPAPSEELSFKIEGQVPAAGDQVDAGEKVVVRIYSRYVESLIVPDVRGMTRVQAMGYLKQLGFKVAVKTRQEAPDEENSEVVWDQSPRSGAELTGDEAVVSITAYRTWEPEEEEEEVPELDPEEEGPEFILVICDSYFPKVPDRLPEGMKVSQWLSRLSIANANWQPVDQKTFITVGGDGLSAYPPEFFTVGKTLSSPIRISMSAGAFDGALLLKVSRVIVDEAEAKRALGGGDWRKAPAGLIALPMQRADGYFDVSASNQGQQFRMSGGPLTAGWTRDAKSGNLRMFKQIAAMFDCFIATAIFDDIRAPELQALRKFRDRVLLKSEKGQELVRHYYRVGPGLAQRVARAPKVRRALLPMAAWLSEALSSEEPERYEWLIDWAHQVLIPWLETEEKQTNLDPLELLQLM